MIANEVLALAESSGWPTVRGLVGGGEDGLHWRLRIPHFTARQLEEARAILSGEQLSPETVPEPLVDDWSDAHKFHTASASNDVVDPSKHLLCPICNPPEGQQNGKVREETAEERSTRIWACRTYKDPDSQVNKLQYITDMLTQDPATGQKLIDAQLWTGEYDAYGTPIPTPRLIPT